MLLNKLIVISAFVSASYTLAQNDCVSQNDPTGLNYDGLENRGTPIGKSRTAECLVWNTVDKKGADHRYCRNPNKDSIGIWCYVSGDVSGSHVIGYCQDPCGTDNAIIPPVVASDTCRGKTTSLTTGEEDGGIKPCLNWDSLSRKGKPFKKYRQQFKKLKKSGDAGDHNNCRNPDNDPGGPWCYVGELKNKGGIWGYCVDPTCGDAGAPAPAEDLNFDGETECGVTGKRINILKHRSRRATSRKRNKKQKGRRYESSKTSKNKVPLFSFTSKNSKKKIINIFQQRKKPNPKYRTVPKSKFKINKGDKTIIKYWPWQISIYWNAKSNGNFDFLCGGVIINQHWILTAAHCFADPGEGFKYMNSMKAGVRIVVGETDRHTTFGGIPADHIRTLQHHPIVHEGWKIGNGESDISIAQVNKAFKYDEMIQPACLSNTNFENIIAAEFKKSKAPDGKEKIRGLKSMCYITGMGGLDDANTGEQSERLYKARIYPHETDDCVEEIKQSMGVSKIGVGQLCASSTTGANACQGDSGGPFQCQLRKDKFKFKGKRIKKYIIRGLTSYGPNCGLNVTVQEPVGIYTKVSNYLGWINDRVTFIQTLSGRYTSSSQGQSSTKKAPVKRFEAKGRGLKKCRKGTTCTFLLKTYGIRGGITLSLQGPSGGKTRCYDSGKQPYDAKCSYKASRTGMHTIQITQDGNHIKGSPFKVNVT